MENNLVKYIYIHHPYYPEHVLTIARKWLDAEKTKLAVAWCANRCSFAEYATVQDGYIPRFYVEEAFNRKTARDRSRGLLDAVDPAHGRVRVVVDIGHTWDRKVDGSIVSRAVNAVYPTLPTSLKDLVDLARYESFKTPGGSSQLFGFDPSRPAMPPRRRFSMSSRVLGNPNSADTSNLRDVVHHAKAPVDKVDAVVEALMTLDGVTRAAIIARIKD